MLNYSYTPKWKNLFNPFFKNHSDNFSKIIKNVWCAGNKDYFKLFTRSSWAIYFLIFSKLKEKKNKQVLIWLPSYYCNDVIYLIKKINVKILYYDVDDNFLADTESLKKLSTLSSPDIILFCHFFGKNKFISYFKDLSLKHKSFLIEDCTHVISPSNSIGKNGDIAIYSPYKFFPIPHGAIMTVSKKFLLENKLIYFLNEVDYNNFIKEALGYLNYKKKNNFLLIGIWVVKKILTKFKLNYSKFVEFSYQSKINNKYYFCYPLIERYSLNILINYAKNIYLEKDKRKTMFFLWKRYLLNNSEFSEDNFAMSNYSQDETPYFLILSNFNNNILHIYNLLKQKKIPVLTWPDLAEEVMMMGNSSSANFLKKSIIFLPLHEQSKALIKKIILKKNNNFNNFLFKEIFKKSEWDLLYKNSENPNLLQSWEYAEAQKKFYNLSIQRFLIQDTFNNDLGIVQVLCKSFGIFKFYKVNKGPVFFKNSENIKNDVVLSIISKIKKEKIFSFLSITPNINFSYDNILLNFNRKNILFSPPLWKSFNVDLKIEEDLLNKSLTSKWRNQLEVSKKSNIIIKQENSKENLLQLIELNKADANKKNFKSISSNFLTMFLNSSHHKLFNAYLDNCLISSICISVHEPNSTYLIGWSNEEGRKFNAMNQLIWKSIFHLKNNKVTNLDLGGYDIDNSRGIFDFKNGVGGESFKLVGNKFIW